MRVCLFRHSRLKRAQAIPASSTFPNRAEGVHHGLCRPRYDRSRPSARPGSSACRGRGGRHRLRTEGGGQRERTVAVRAQARADDLRCLRPDVPQRRCSRWRSPQRSSASSTTTRRSSPATGGMVPNDFHVELSETDLDRLAPYDTAMGEELVKLLEDHADQQSYVFPGPVSIELRGGRRPDHRPVPRPQPGPGEGHRQRQPHPGTPRPRRCSRSTAPGTRSSLPAS